MMAINKIKITEKTLPHIISKAEYACIAEPHSVAYIQGLFTAITQHIKAIPDRKRVVKVALALDLSPLERCLARQAMQDIPELVTEYKKFLAIKVLTGDVALPQSFSPSPLVDQVWHQHLLLPGHYLATCKILQCALKSLPNAWRRNLKIIDHDPTSARDDPEEKAQKMARTMVVYREMFDMGSPIPYHIWDPLEGTMEIFCNTMAGQRIPCQVTPDSSVALLKLLVQNKKNYPTEQQRLFFAGQSLEHDRTLASYQITKGSTLILLHGC